MHSQARELIPQNHPRIFGLVEIYCALSSYMMGQKQTIFQQLNDKIRTGRVLSGALLSRLFIARSFLYQLSGEVHQSAQDAHSVKDISIQSNIGYIEGWADYLQGVSFFRSYDLAATLVHFSPSIEYRYVMHTRAAFDAMVGLALTFQAMKQPDAVKETIEKMLDFAHETGDRQLLSVALSGQVRVALAQDNIELATRWLQSFDEKAIAPSMFIWLEFPLITRARVQIAIGSINGIHQACESLEMILKILKEQNNICQQIEIMPLLALAYNKLSRIDEALKVLKTAVFLSMNSDWTRPFVELGLPMVDLLEKLELKDNTLGTKELLYIKKIHSFFTVRSDRQTISLSHNQSLAEPLTKREIEILALLKHRLSNQEISEKLFISTETVKSHLKTIYSKFGVGKRKDAVAKAHELRLFEH